LTEAAAGGTLSPWQRFARSAFPTRTSKEALSMIPRGREPRTGSRHPSRLPLALSSAALIVAVLGSTPAASAAREALEMVRNSVGPQHIRTGAVQTRHLAKNSVAGPVIRSGVVTTRHLAPNAVNGDKIAEGSLRAAHFRAGEMIQGAPGPQGPAGPAGPAGAQGPPGPTFGAVQGTGTGVSGALAPLAFKVEVVTTTPARLFVFGVVMPTMTCGQQACARTYILTVNGQPVSTTGASISGAAGRTVQGEMSRFGVVAVPRGRHIVEWARRDSGTHVTSSTGATVGAIVLGGAG
jgi:hypothetical protein